MDIFSKKLLLASLSSAYEEDEVLVNSQTAGSNSVEILQNGVYQLDIVGGGGGCASALSWGSASSSSSSGNSAKGAGGSGASFVGEIFLRKGTYTYYVGNKGSSNNNHSTKTTINTLATSGEASYIALGNMTLITVGGGGGGYASAGYTNNVKSATGGAAGSAPVIDSSVDLRTTILNISGNRGDTDTDRVSSNVQQSTHVWETLSNYTYDKSIGQGAGSGGSDYHSKTGLIKIKYLRKK